MIEKLITHPAMHLGAHLGYFSGLTMMIPILGTAWSSKIKPWLVSPNGFIIALVLIGISILLLAFAAKSISRLFKSVGWLMVFPGILALVFSVFGEASFWGFLNNKITGFSVIEPAAKWLIHHSVPNAIYLGIVYIAVGIAFVWVGRRIQAVTDYV